MGRCQLIFEEKTTLNYYYISGVGWRVCDTSSCQLTEAHLSKSSNWIGVQTGVHGFDSRTPHKPVVSKASETDIWLSSYDHLTDVRGQRGGCQQLSQPRVHTWGYPILAYK